MKHIILSAVILLTMSAAQSENLVLDGQVIPLNNSSIVSINPVSGDITATSQDGNLTCTSGSSGSPPIVNLNTSATTVVSGGSATLSWTVANSATSCVASGAWSGNKNPAGGSQLIPDITASGTYVLTCSNQFGNGSDNVSISVQVTVPTGCEDTPPPAGMSEDNDPSSWDAAMPGTGFPGIIGQEGKFIVDVNKYVALNFTTPNSTTIDQKIVFEEPPPTIPPVGGQTVGQGDMTITISECPGDFSHHLGQSNCKVTGLTPNMQYTTENPPGFFRCKLEPNKQYYLNIVHSTNAPNYTPTSCSHPTRCGVIMNVNNN